jgi:endonuclease III-like uncharacterized protein
MKKLAQRKCRQDQVGSILLQHTKWEIVKQESVNVGVPY